MAVPSQGSRQLGWATLTLQKGTTFSHLKAIKLLRAGKGCLWTRIYLNAVKAGVHLKAVFWLGIMFLMQISRLRFKQSRICSLITHIYVLRRFVNFLVIFRFIWRQIVFLKGLVKFMEIGNFEDLVLF